MLRRSIYTFLLIVWCGTASSQGLKLFSPEMKGAVPPNKVVVMDFLERYFGKELPSQRQTTRENKMADDKVYFRKGKPSDLYQVTDSMPFSINLLDRYYEVKWMKADEPFVTIVFPAQYDLILGMQQEEAQNRLKEAIFAAPVRSNKIGVPAKLEKLDDSIYMFKTEKFELESLNDAIYFNKVHDDYMPVFDNQHLDYSAANLFHGLIDDTSYQMYVEQSVYGMKTISYSMTLSQWLNYCNQLGMKVYFGIEEQRQDGMLAIVVAQSRELGFNHLLSVVIPDKFVNDKKAVMKVRLTPYIPTHNVKDLYKQETLHHKKKNWQ